MIRQILLVALLALAGCAATDHRHVVESEVEALRLDVADLAAQVEHQADAIEAAHATAQAALDAAREAQACCAANAERIDRVFEEAQQK